MNNKILSGLPSKSAHFDYAWWNDLVELEQRLFESIFSKNWVFSLGDITSILFWKVNWLREVSLMALFLDMYQLSKLKEAAVVDMGSWIDNAGSGAVLTLYSCSARLNKSTCFLFFRCYLSMLWCWMFLTRCVGSQIFNRDTLPNRVMVFYPVFMGATTSMNDSLLLDLFGNHMFPIWLNHLRGGAFCIDCQRGIFFPKVVFIYLLVISCVYFVLVRRNRQNISSLTVLFLSMFGKIWRFSLVFVWSLKW